MAVSIRVMPSPQPVADALKEMCTMYGIESEVLKWLTSDEGLCAQSVAQFLHVFADASEVKAVVDTIVTTNKLQQTARVRQAWTELTKATTAADLIKARGLDTDDMDSLLPTVQMESLNKAFWGRYKMSYPPHVEPSETLVSRLSREMDKRVLSVRAISKVHSKDQQIRSVRKMQNISETIELVTGEVEDDDDVYSVQQYLQKLMTLLIAYAKAGCTNLATQPANTEGLGSDPCMYVAVPLDVLMRYLYRAQDRVSSMPNALQLQWLQKRDEDERAGN